MNQDQSQLIELYQQARQKLDEFETDAHSTVILLTDIQKDLQAGKYKQIKPDSEDAKIFLSMMEKETSLNREIFNITDELRLLEEKIGTSHDLLAENVTNYMHLFSNLVAKRSESNIQEILLWLSKRGVVSLKQV